MLKLGIKDGKNVTLAQAFWAVFGEIRGLFTSSPPDEHPRRAGDILAAEEYYAIHGMEVPGYAKGFSLAPFQPFLNMGKDLVDTFKPYKGFYQSTSDFLQPAKGLKNIVGGLMGLAFCFALMIPLILIAELFFVLLTFVTVLFTGGTSRHQRDMLFLTLASLGISASWIAESAITILRGVTQIAAAPLTWFIKMPLRGIITLFTGVPDVEDSKVINRLARKGQNCLDTDPEAREMAGVINAVHAKFICAVNKGQGTKLDVEREKATYNQFISSLERVEDIDAVIYRGRPTNKNKTLARQYLNQFFPVATSRNFLMFAYKHTKDEGAEIPALIPDVVGVIGGFFYQATDSDAKKHADGLQKLNERSGAVQGEMENVPSL
jgi:hypothetical protein